MQISLINNACEQQEDGLIVYYTYVMAAALQSAASKQMSRTFPDKRNSSLKNLNVDMLGGNLMNSNPDVLF